MTIGRWSVPTPGSALPQDRFSRECYPNIHSLMDPIRIDVPTPSRSYTVTIADGALDRLAPLLDELRVPPRRFVVSSTPVWRFHGPRLERAITIAGEPILVPDGERFKQLPTVARIYDALVRFNADRASTVITFGGGVIGDMAGFAAATYLRGMALVHVPTTLLAQVDSAIGGKVGVNHPLGKNLIGAFYQPHAVVIDPQVLGTLARREFRAGLYEVVKYGMTSSAPLFDRIVTGQKAIFNRVPEALTPVIVESCRIIADIEPNLMLEAMQRDKKTVDGRLHFVLPIAIGATTIADDVTDKELRAVLNRVGFKG